MHIVKKSMSKFYASKEIPWKLLPIIVVIIVITFLYLYVNVICYFQVHRGHIKSDLSLAIFCYVIML
jgi:hypothetical protein